MRTRLALSQLIASVALLIACGRERPAFAWQGGGAATPDERAAAALRTGRYDEAIALYKDLASPPTASAASRRGYLRALAAVGRYDEAEVAGRQFAAAGPDANRVLAEVLLARGKRAGAESLLAIASARASDSLVARERLAESEFARGARDQAMRRFSQFIDIYNGAKRKLTSEELAAVAEACRYLGRDDPQLFKDALKAYDQAIAADTANLDARVRLARMFLEKYNAAEARQTIETVLAVNPRDPDALVVAARRASFDGEGSASSYVRRALEVNANDAEARALLSAMLLDGEKYADAAKEAERALAIDPTSAEAHAIYAASRTLTGDAAGFDAAQKRALAAGVPDADFFTALAQVAARNRLYREARGFAHEATTRDPKAWRSWSVLGLNELRAGDVPAARTDLEKAFKGDPYDPWVKNTLDLLDTFQKDYREARTQRFQFFLDEKESALLALYAGPLAEEAYDSLQARYGFAPQTPVRVEVYSNHEDFSVRTVGLAGLGALGVSFGNVLAIDSPSARKAGDFNWGSTLWHEIAHAFTLGMTKHRVPRWLSEGLSVMEERRARQGWGWGMDASPDFLLAYKAGRLPPPSALNDAFLRPKYPAQVMHAYEEASLVCEMIERELGHAAIVAMLNGYRDGLTTEQVMQRALKLEPSALDARFDAYVRSRYATALGAMKPTEVARGGRRDSTAAPTLTDDGEFVKAMRDGVAAYDAGRSDDAASKFESAKKLFPEFGGEGSAYWYLAKIAEKKGDWRRVAEELGAMTARDESNAAANLELAGALERLGDKAGAARALERLVYIAPFDVAPHERLANLAGEAGQHATAVRERRAVIALGPADVAQARYELAVALRDAGDAPAAKREVLKALELAPAFEKAQTLLLALSK